VKSPLIKHGIRRGHIKKDTFYKNFLERCTDHISMWQAGPLNQVLPCSFAPKITLQVLGMLHRLRGQQRMFLKLPEVEYNVGSENMVLIHLLSKHAIISLLMKQYLGEATRQTLW
jgi:hypothetical protein